MRRPATNCHDGKCNVSSTHGRMGKSMAILYVGVDLAKIVFAVHGVHEHGKPALVRPGL